MADLLARYVAQAMTWDAWDEPLATLCAAGAIVLGVVIGAVSLRG